MRNYIALDNAFVIGDDGSGPLQLAFFGQFPGEAFSEAATVAQILLASGWISAEPISNAPIYALLSHDLITGLLIGPTQGSQPAGGLAGFGLWNQIVAFAQAIGVDPLKSPKEQGVKPWNGRPTRVHRPRGKLVPA